MIDKFKLKIRKSTDERQTKPVLQLSQFDIAPQGLVLYLVDEQDNPITIPDGLTIEVQGRKEDNTAFAYTDVATYTGNTITVDIVEQMTACDGKVDCEIRLISEAGANIGTGNFILFCEKSPIGTDPDYSHTDMPDYIEAAKKAVVEAQEAAEKAEEAAAQVEEIKDEVDQAARDAAEAIEISRSVQSSFTTITEAFEQLDEEVGGYSERITEAEAKATAAQELAAGVALEVGELTDKVNSQDAKIENAENDAREAKEAVTIATSSIAKLDVSIKDIQEEMDIISQDISAADTKAEEAKTAAQSSMTTAQAAQDKAEAVEAKLDDIALQDIFDKNATQKVTGSTYYDLTLANYANGEERISSHLVSGVSAEYRNAARTEERMLSANVEGVAIEEVTQGATAKAEVKPGELTLGSGTTTGFKVNVKSGTVSMTEAVKQAFKEALNIPDGAIVDEQLSETSTNAVQNQAITRGINAAQSSATTAHQAAMNAQLLAQQADEAADAAQVTANAAQSSITTISEAVNTLTDAQTAQAEAIESLSGRMNKAEDAIGEADTKAGEAINAASAADAKAQAALDNVANATSSIARLEVSVTNLAEEFAEVSETAEEAKAQATSNTSSIAKLDIRVTQLEFDTDDLLERINANKTSISLIDNKAEAASNKADAAAQNASRASALATAAQSVANQARNEAQAAQSSVATVSEAVDSLSGRLGKAEDAIGEVDTKAGTAMNTANEAKTEAQAATSSIAKLDVKIDEISAKVPGTLNDMIQAEPYQYGAATDETKDQVALDLTYAGENDTYEGAKHSIHGMRAERNEGIFSNATSDLTPDGLTVDVTEDVTNKRAGVTKDNIYIAKGGNAVVIESNNMALSNEDSESTLITPSGVMSYPAPIDVPGHVISRRSLVTAYAVGYETIDEEEATGTSTVTGSGAANGELYINRRVDTDIQTEFKVSVDGIKKVTMTEDIRQAFMEALFGRPEYIKPVEYIRSNGGNLQYLDTGLTLDGALEIEALVRTEPDSAAIFFDAYTETTQRMGGICYNRANPRYDYWWTGVSCTNGQTSAIDFTKPFTLKQNAQGVTITQGATIETATYNGNPAITNPETPLYICHTDRTTIDASCTIIYSVKIRKDGELLRDMIAALDTRTMTPGLYDKVTGQMFGSANNPFEYGPAI